MEPSGKQCKTSETYFGYLGDRLSELNQQTFTQTLFLTYFKDEIR